MKILIAGFGSIGRRHFRNLYTLGERDFVFLRSGRSTLLDDEIASYPVETNLEAALAHHPDAVIVANPTALHLDVAIPAAQAGCHLFLEKPISHSMDGMDLLTSAIQRGGGEVFVGFQFRFHPGLNTIKGLLDGGEFGKPLSVRVHWGEYLPGWHPWEDYREGYSARKDLGGGVVLTLCHPLDYLRWLLGEVRSLWAFVANRSELDLDVEDTAEIGLRFDGGTLGSVHLDYNQRPPSHRLELVCSEGTIHWNYDTGTVEAYEAASGIWAHYPPPPGFERNQMFLAEMAHFLRVAQGQEKSSCDLDDGVKSLALTMAVHASANQGQLVTLL
jgi:predicted dehydrogenase